MVDQGISLFIFVGQVHNSQVTLLKRVFSSTTASQLGRAVSRLPAKTEATRVMLAEYSFQDSYLGVYPLAPVLLIDVSEFGSCNLEKPDRHCCSKPLLCRS
jgi:hypothetical protein